ncbi:MAG: GNAT family N-acetyltransferase, partial [Janthinobacterium lividum]
GPFQTYEGYRAWAVQASQDADPFFFAVVDKSTNRALGVASYLRIQPQHGVIEIGSIHFSPLLQRTSAATEALYLMIAHVFSLGYRRCEWKCDALNAPSRAAALRLGFTFEGVFRQAIVYKGRSRDTAWFAIIDRDWPRLDAAFQAWLDPANFNEEGLQKAPLAARTPP